MLLLLCRRLIRKAVHLGPGLSPMLDANSISPDDIESPHRTFPPTPGIFPFAEIYFPRLSRAYTAPPYIVGFDLYNKGRSRECIRLNHVPRTSSPLLAATSQYPLEPGSCCPLVIVSSTRSTVEFVSRARAVRHASGEIDCLSKAMAPPPRFLNSFSLGQAGWTAG